MRPDRVIFVAKAARDDLGLEHAGQHLAVEAFVAKAAVEALVHAVLPRAARFDEARDDAGRFEPLLQFPRNELAPIVTAQMTGRAVHCDRSRERLHHFRGAEPPTGDDVDAVVAAFVDEGEELHGRAALRHIEHQIDAPNVVEPIGLEFRVRSRRALRPARWPDYSQAFASTHALHRAPRTRQTLPFDQRMHPAITVTRMLV